MSRAFRCEICEAVPAWRFVRRGDVVVSWACPEHMSEVAFGLQRPHEKTTLLVTDFRKSVEADEIDKSLEAIVKDAERTT